MEARPVDLLPILLAVKKMIDLVLENNSQSDIDKTVHLGSIYQKLICNENHSIFLYVL